MEMDGARWEQVQTLFHAAVGLPGPDRETWLAGATDDRSLVQDVMNLLAADTGPSLVDGGLDRLARGLLDGGGPAGDLPGAIGAYEIERLVGEGGMGVVFSATRADLGNRVAIKLLRDGWVSPSRRHRFDAERRTLAQLQHPGIARLYDAGTLPDGTPWFAMEFVEGVPITDFCYARALPLTARLRLFREVCEAVLYAHRRLIVHRDLKPSNILVGSDGRPKLLDFGIAKQIAAAVDLEQTRTVLRLMTPAYAAPEQIRGERPTVQTDVYALGVLLYEMLAGQRPFDLSDKSAAAAEAVLLDQEPPKPSVSRSARRVPARRGAWTDLDVLALTAMHKDPRRRYGSVEALVRDVDQFLGKEPLDARAGSLLRYRTGKLLRRRWRSLTAAAAMLALMAGLTGFYTARLNAARHAAVQEAARAQRIQQFMLNLFREDESGTAPASELRVVTLLDRGGREARSLDADPVLQAGLFETLGSINQQLARFDAASPLLESAVALRRSRGDDGATLADSLVSLALLRIDEARLDEGGALLEEALGLIERQQPPSALVQARATAALGRLYIERGDNDRAIATLAPAVRLLDTLPEARNELSVALTSLANAHFYAGHYAESLALNERSLALDRSMYGERHPNIGHDLLNIGSIHEQRADLTAAVAQYRAGLDVFREWFGDDHPETASARTILAQALRGPATEAEALALLRSALATQTRVYGPLHSRVAFVQNALGGVALRARRFNEAAAAFTDAARIYRAAHSPTHVRVGIATANLASVHLARHDYPPAIRLFEEALRIYAQSIPPDHLNVGIARVKLGRALAGLGRFQAALDQLTEGVRIIEKQSGPQAPWLADARADIAAANAALHKDRPGLH